MFDFRHSLKYLYYLSLFLNLIIIKYDSRSKIFTKFPKYLRLLFPFWIAVYISINFLLNNFLVEPNPNDNKSVHVDSILLNVLLFIESFQNLGKFFVIYIIAYKKGGLLLKLCNIGKGLLNKGKILEQSASLKKRRLDIRAFAIILMDWLFIIVSTIGDFIFGYGGRAPLDIFYFHVVFNLVVDVFYINFVHGAYSLDIIQDELEKCLKNQTEITKNNLSRFRCLIKYHGIIDRIDNMRQFLWEVHEFTLKMGKLMEKAFLLIFADIFMIILNAVCKKIDTENLIPM